MLPNFNTWAVLPFELLPPGSMFVREDVEHFVPQFGCDDVVAAASRRDEMIAQFLLLPSLHHGLGTQTLGLGMPRKQRYTDICWRRAENRVTVTRLLLMTH